MKAKLTSRTIKDLAPAEKAYEVVDTDVKGFLLRVQPTGRMTYYYAYRTTSGSKKRIKIGSHGAQLTVQQARDLATRYAGQVAEGKDIQEEKQSSRKAARAATEKTLKRFTENHYRPWAQTNLKSSDSTIQSVYASFPDLLDTPMADISVAWIERWRVQRLKDGNKPATLNRLVNALRSILTKAVEWETIEEHPLRKLKALHVDNAPKVRYLNSDEEARLYTALKERDLKLKEARARANEHRAIRGYELMSDLFQFTYGDRLTPLVTLSLKTGMRRGELFDLTWENVNLDTKVITVTAETAKSRRTRHIPLGPTALKVLTAWKQQAPLQAGRVFPADDGSRLDNVNTAWRNLLKAAGITNFRWHDMRHDFASKLVMKGVPLNTVRELCGHSGLDTTLRYAHLAPDHKADAVALIG
uniref:site-specific integrase n=1 Tax=Microbulbifer agarilyticus TaxID=260552 RepID=UPI000255B94E|nr:site-specific integrase [Microbulbifer agarilyticus]